MKYFLIIVALIVAVVLAALYAPIDNGKPLITPNTFEQAISSGEIPTITTSSQSSTVPNMYKWQDQDGIWQYGQTPPPGISAEPVQLNETQRMETFTEPAQ